MCEYSFSIPYRHAGEGDLLRKAWKLHPLLSRWKRDPLRVSRITHTKRGATSTSLKEVLEYLRQRYSDILHASTQAYSQFTMPSCVFEIFQISFTSPAYSLALFSVRGCPFSGTRVQRYYKKIKPQRIFAVLFVILVFMHVLSCLSCMFSAWCPTFPRWESYIPTVGILHSHGGNPTFPRWESDIPTVGILCRHRLRHDLGSTKISCGYGLRSRGVKEYPVLFTTLR